MPDKNIYGIQYDAEHNRWRVVEGGAMLHKEASDFAMARTTAGIKGHEDYSLPLEVNWLCPVHHMAVHKAEGLSKA